MERLQHRFKSQAGCPGMKRYGEYKDIVIRHLRESYHPDATVVSSHTIAWGIAQDPKDRKKFPEQYQMRTLIAASAWNLVNNLGARRDGAAYVLPVPVRLVGRA